MGNMSYCRFKNTLSDLDECYRVMCGDDDYYMSKNDLSSEEFSAMEDLIETCRNIVSLVDNQECPLFEESDECDDEDDDDN